MSTRLVRVILVVVVVCALFGCDRLRDVKRCRTLAHTVNTSLDTIEKVTEGKPTRAGYDRATLEYEAIAKNLAEFDAGTPELAKAVEDYVAVARSSAHASASMAQALGANNSMTMQLATRELERVGRQEKAVVRRIDEECQPR